MAQSKSDVYRDARAGKKTPRPQFEVGVAIKK